MKVRYIALIFCILSALLTVRCKDDNGSSTGPSDQVTLTIAVTPSGTGTTTPSAGSHDYDEDTVVTVIARPASGYRFVNWSGDVADASNDTTTVVMSADRSVTAHFQELSSEVLDITFVSIPGGTFQMGNVENASEGLSKEKPVHSVTLTGFEMSIHEVTNAQYCTYLNAAKDANAVTATNTFVSGATGSWSGINYIYLEGYLSSYPDNDCKIVYNGSTFSVKEGYENWPVAWVTWYGSKAFANYYGFDLPTESEWEYACRGGQQLKYGTDNGTINGTKANYSNNIHHLVAVGNYPANPFGLRNMSGNVWEWCHDWYEAYTSSSAIDPTGAQSGSYRVLRGGGWYGDDGFCRSAYRYDYNPYGWDSYIGFRVVRRAGGVIY